MADRLQCEAALRDLASRLDLLAQSNRAARTPDRVIVCRIPDLETTFSGHLRGGCLHDIGEGERPGAQITLTLSSDDLLAVTSGTLSVTSAWASGRLKVDASVRDLLRVRALL
ncbi:SCP-2 sterol transfer family protein [Parafrankia irregularis]|uniref:SCP-2 sterol transfer family protein n=1 Tax=Parafrankia irregularis TaxID=795642 RepID=A0A0S4QX74_9ACTN|nr:MULTISPECIES: alkyl sulfatase C-terminal domain-containing protein [Parafrankia]MBE3206304.1 SCP2 sterol-binding domain-containing protein [Parafrankia sp. CH37]CUU60135.1 SCP-2 sterol transfer family protein [Parafrankia irregularis]